MPRPPGSGARPITRSSLLAFLAEGDSYGYALKREFETRTGGSWPINIGQIYSTLARLEPDGLVASAGTDGDGRPLYRITDGGRAEAASWFATPVAEEQARRDELAIKVAIAMSAPEVDLQSLMQAQRSASLRRMQELTRTKAQPDADPARVLVIDRMIFDVEAELRWLDHCGQRVLRRHREISAAAHSAFKNVGDGPGSAPSGIPGPHRPRETMETTQRDRVGGAFANPKGKGMAEQPVVVLHHVTKTSNQRGAPVQALRDVSLQVAPGEMVAVMGASGSGKSTLLNLVGALDVPTGGQVLLDGVDLASLSNSGRAQVRRRRVGFVFQDFNLVPTLTAGENVAMPLSLDGVSWHEARPQAQRLLDEVGPVDVTDRFPVELSGGERQRVAVAPGADR